MSSHVRILGIDGSLRRGSYNQAALRAAKLLVPENHEKALARTTLGSREGGRTANSLYESALRKEAITAFFEKRPPDFTRTAKVAVAQRT